MRLYEITYNGRKWETTNGDEAYEFLSFLNGYVDADVRISRKLYTGPEIPNIQVA